MLSRVRLSIVDRGRLVYITERTQFLKQFYFLFRELMLLRMRSRSLQNLSLRNTLLPGHPCIKSKERQNGGDDRGKSKSNPFASGPLPNGTIRRQDRPGPPSIEEGTQLTVMGLDQTFASPRESAEKL